MQDHTILQGNESLVLGPGVWWSEDEGIWDMDLEPDAEKNFFKKKKMGNSEENWCTCCWYGFVGNSSCWSFSAESYCIYRSAESLQAPDLFTNIFPLAALQAMKCTIIIKWTEIIQVVSSGGFVDFILLWLKIKYKYRGIHNRTSWKTVGVVLQKLPTEISLVLVCHWKKSYEIASSSGTCFIENFFEGLNHAFFSLMRKVG